MIISQLRMTNFMSHSDFVETFSSGTNAIVGKNGTGKSSILKAIGIALFDSKPSTLQKLIKTGSSDSSIEIEFSHQNSNFLLTRVIGKKTSIKLESDNLSLSKTTDVYSFLSELLSVKIPIVFDQIYINTSNLHFPFNIEGSKRKAFLNQTFNLERFDKARNDLKEVSRILREKSLVTKETIRNYENLIKEIKSGESNLSLFKEELKTVLGKLKYQDNITSLVSKKEIIEKRLSLLENEINRSISELESLLDYSDKLGEQTCPNCNQKLPDTVLLSLLEKNRSKINSVKSKISKYETEKKLLLSDLGTINVPKEFNSDQSLRSKAIVLQSNINRIERDLINAQIRESELSEATYILRELERKQSKLDLVREGINSCVPILSRSICDQISYVSSEFASSIFGVPVSILLDDDYNLSVVYKDSEFSFDQLSDGERVSVSLAIKMSMANYLASGLNLIILDEPTINLDNYARDNLAQLLRTLDSQIFVVSHDTTFEQYIDKVIYL